MQEDRIVAVGLLTQRDLDALGTRFHRLFPIERDDSFDDLVAQLDAIPALPPVPSDRGSAIHAIVEEALHRKRPADRR